MSKQVRASRISEININELQIKNKKGNKAPILYKKEPIIIETPYLEVSIGVRDSDFPEIYLLDTLLKGDTREKINSWFQFIEKLEDHVVTQVLNNGSNWFTEKNVNVKSLIRDPKPGSSIYSIKWPLDSKLVKYIDRNKNPYDYRLLKSGDRIKLIVKIPSLWIDQNQCGLAVIVQKILVRPQGEESQRDYSFNESDDSFENEENIVSILASEQKPHSKDFITKYSQNSQSLSSTDDQIDDQDLNIKVENDSSDFD